MQNLKLTEEFFGDLPRGRYEGYIGQAPNAHFESVENILATKALRFEVEKNLEAKMLLGVLGGHVQSERLPDGRVVRWVEGGHAIGVADDRHRILFAGSRSSKGRSCILPSLFLLPWTTSILAIDPKGENARIAANYRYSVLQQPTAVLDPFGCSGEVTRQFRAVYNPIQFLDPTCDRTFVPQCKLISDALVVAGHHSDRHWDTTAESMLACLIAFVAASPLYRGRRNLISVWELASELGIPDPENPSLYVVEKLLKESDAASGMIRAAARQFYDRTGGEFSSVLSTLRKHIDFLSVPAMRNVLVGDSIDLRNLKRSSLCCFVSLPTLLQRPMAGWLRMIVQMTLAACEEETEILGGPTEIILDEFNVLQRMTCIEVAIAQIAGFHARLNIILQDLNQLKHHHPENFETFIGNSGVIQVFGCNDNATLGYFSKMMGQSMTLTRSTNAPTFEQASQQGATGESWSLANHPLMTPQEICEFFSRDDCKLRQLILRPGYAPMILQRIYYDKHEFFKGRYIPEERS